MGAYFLRHWRGQLSLATSWWVNGIGLAVLSLAIELNAGRLGATSTLTTRGGFTVYLALGILLGLLIPAWQVVGIFRAGDRHADEVGTLLGARLVQALATVLALALAVRFLAFAGDALAGARLAYPLPGSGYRVAVTDQGRVIEVSGGLLFGVTDEVRAALAANPGVRRLRLNSGGGALTEGQALRDLVLAHGLDTDSTTGCDSACVSAYIGGRRRLLHRSARLGFHLPRNTGLGRRERVAASYLPEIAYFSSAGVPDWFRLRWINAGRTFWYPTPRQLHRAGLVHSFYGRPRQGEDALFLPLN